MITRRIDFFEICARKLVMRLNYPAILCALSENDMGFGPPLVIVVIRVCHMITAISSLWSHGYLQDPNAKPDPTRWCSRNLCNLH